MKKMFEIDVKDNVHLLFQKVKLHYAVYKPVPMTLLSLIQNKGYVYINQTISCRDCD